MGPEDDVEDLKRRLAAAEAVIAENARLDAAVRDSETRHRLIIESWTQAVWETDGAGVVVTDSPSWRAYTGQTLEQWLGYGWLDAIHPDDRVFAERQWRDAMAARRVVDAEFRLRAPNGGWRWTNVRAAPVLDAQGAIEKWAGVNIDIDARIRAEAALRESEERFRSVSESGVVAIAFFDTAGAITDANDAFLSLVGYSRAEMAAGEVRWDRMTPPEWMPKTREAVRQYQQTGRIEPYEKEYLRRSGERFWGLFGGRRVGSSGEGVSFVLDVTEQKRAEAALRESEERQALLLKLSDAARSATEDSQILRAASRLVGQHFSASSHYAEVVREDGADDYKVRFSFTDPGRPSFDGRYPVASFPGATDELYRGKTVSSADVQVDPRLSESDRASYASADVRNFIAAPLIRNGRLAAVFSVHGPTPHAYSDADARLIEEVAERTWAAIERVRSEDALRASEERFRQFAEASSGALWIRDAQTLKMEYASSAIETIYGVRCEALFAGIRAWASLIVPEDRAAVLADIEAARQGEPRVSEFRVQRANDQAFRWVRNTVFPLLNPQGLVQRIGGIFEDVTEAKLAIEHQGVLLAELQHRVRNIMAIIRSLALRTADGAADVADYRSLLEGRLLALAKVQVLLTRAANAGGSLRDIITSEASAQAHQADQFELEGPEIRLSPKAAEVLTLVFHELATNASKYGAFSTPQGRLHVSWTPFEKRGRTWLALDWTETGAPRRAPPTRRGFGSDLIEGRVPYELGGTGKIVIEPDGAHCRLEFPLRDGESILETDAPTPAKLFGGTLDMTDAPHLTGRRVLVVEDDYYMAGDTAAALRGAGAEVLGPCPSEEATFDLLDGDTPTHAVLDLNLGGGGPRFEIAHDLRARGVPFIFLTGYDPEVIPAGLEDVVRLQKPVPFRKIVEAVNQL